MLELNVFGRKKALALAAFLSLLVGVFVYAWVDRTIIVPEQMIVIPGVVSSDVWQAPEKILINENDDYSLYQDFNESNSAVLSKDYLTPPVRADLPVSTTENTSEEPAATDQSASSSEPNISADELQTPASGDPVPEVSSDSIETSLEPEPEVTPPPQEEDDNVTPPPSEPDEAVLDSSVSTLDMVHQNPVLFSTLPYSMALYPLAQEIINTITDTPPTADNSVEAAIEQTATPVESGVSDEPSFTEEIVTPEESVAEEVVPVAETASDTEAGTDTSSETTATDPIDLTVSAELDLEDETPDGVDGDVIDRGDDEEEVVTDEMAVKAYCDGYENCKQYSVQFDGFTIPEFDRDSFLTGAQLRISLAAQAYEETRDEAKRIVVEYTYSTDGPWLTATTIDIEDEISNSINGGYYLVSLERPSHQSLLSNLKVRVSYQGNIDHIKRAYIEGLWLEVTSASFYEETDPLFNSGALSYDRSLEAPKFHTLETTDLDPALSELPSFSLSYSPQQGFLKRIFTAVFSDNEYAVEKVKITDGAGTEVLIPVEVTYQDTTTWSVEFLKQPQKLVPGKYTVEVVVNENETLYTDHFEFYWGLLAVNTLKSVYEPGDPVTLHLAALTDKGDTICDADLQLKIISPDYTITEVPVTASGACAKNNVTTIPDYLANFTDTRESGRYTIQLQHLNQNGEVVHKVDDFFEVAAHTPFTIERTAPTRIYPPAPYEVGIRVTANQDFVGDITERVPRGFVITGLDGAEILSGPDYTEIVWRNISMLEGDELVLMYKFDAPDISPYMYLLGPLVLDGFEELRQWQIASDALGAIASFSGTRTVGSTNLNQTPSPMQWSNSTLDPFYFDHATSTNSHEVTFRQPGDYFISLTIPHQRTDANARSTRIGASVRINGVAVPEGYARSGYASNQAGNAESSTHANFLLRDIAVDDVLEISVEGLTTINAADIVNVTGQASMYLEYIGIGDTVFSATTTQTINSPNLNQTTEYAFSLIETRQDSGFVHSDAVNPEQIIISNPGAYLVEVNIPLTSTANNTNILGRVRLDGVQVPGGQFKQGFAQAPATESDPDSSIHWSGVVIATTTNQVLTITSLREGNAGTVTVPTSTVGSIIVRTLPASEVIALRGTTVVGGTPNNWNPAASTTIQWSNRDVYDAATFTHSTSTNSHQITIGVNGDYLLSYNDALSAAITRPNTRVEVYKNGTLIPGAQTKTHYIRNQNGHTESSGTLTMLLEGLLSSDIITVTTQAEATAGTVDDTTDAMLMMWKKAELNLRPDAPLFYNAPFDNIRFASTTPYFDFSYVDPDGSNPIEYQFSISTTTGFVASSTFNSASDSEFFNTASTSDSSPFTEGERVRFQLTGADSLTDLTTYYWRIRARDVGGSGQFGDWSTTQSLTVDLAAPAPSWFQTYSGQFEGDTLVGTVSSGLDRVQVDASVSQEALIAYGEGTSVSPKYRLWNGTSWGVEGSAQNVTDAINWLEVAAGVSRDEYIMLTLDASSDAYAQVYTASTSSWGNLTLMSPVVNNNAYRGIAVGYESLSGDAMAVSCTNSPNPVYRIWNGTSWSATSSITVSSLNNCNFLEIASDPASDEMILIVRDTGTQYEALVWNGSAWVDSRVIGSSAKLAREGISLAYESSGDQAVVVVSNGINNSISYTTWNGVEFSTNATQALGNDFEFGTLVNDPDTDELALCYIDEDNDVGVLKWNGGVWATFLELDTGGNADTGRPVDCTYETLAGRTNYLQAVFSDTTDVRYRQATSTTWTTEVTVAAMQDAHWVKTERTGDGKIITVILDDTSDDLESSYWNGSSWSTKENLETNPSSILAVPYEMYDLAAKRFQFSQGVVQTPPIDFTAVPNQVTWGDFSFSTTEPFGTDVKVRVRYSNVGICDAYVPDIALAGNSAGFDVASSSVNLVSMSTTTYDQICLEATLTTLGSESAALDEWILSWVRQPKLAQNNYRWYVNGSFLTPTDVWPAGVEDLGVGAPVTSEMAVNIDDTIRLRLALEGENVTLPAISEAFKLQFAAGQTCTQALTWADVGGPASTTALWRGYANAIVGSDWYSGSWSRRIKLTVRHETVDANLTDFPVYINLANLPAGFFTNVQSDGDDIRITKIDGVTEVPYELVSINTTLKTGELHFKADLASTTNTEFYLYYANSGALGYAAGATYGSRNVWTNGYEAVYHLETSPVSALVDSTSNATKYNCCRR